MKSVSKKWDDGCKDDHVRNVFIIPKLINLFSEIKVDRVLDVGAGTGYIARTIDARLSCETSWTLLDRDQNRIDFAETLIPSDMQAETYVGEFLLDDGYGQSYDLVLILFTLLEMELKLELFSKVNSVLIEGGHVVIAMPDSLEDVHKAALEDPSLLNDFLDGKCVVEKTDKFTDESYPFKAHRFEYIVQLMLYSEFSLEKMYSYKNSGKETFMLVFKKKMVN